MVDERIPGLRISTAHGHDQIVQSRLVAGGSGGGP
jgi:hypothetical protein